MLFLSQIQVGELAAELVVIAPDHLLYICSPSLYLPLAGLLASHMAQNFLQYPVWQDTRTVRTTDLENAYLQKDHQLEDPLPAMKFTMQLCIP